MKRENETDSRERKRRNLSLILRLFSTYFRSDLRIFTTTESSAEGREIGDPTAVAAATGSLALFEMPSVFAGAINTVGTIFWTAVYFVYFLVK